MRFYTTEQLGTTQSVTPDGFLVCQDVPIARVGDLVYSEDELPLKGIGGQITVRRTPDEVFRPETIASFSGKPVVDGHPFEDVNPENWRRYAVGTVLHPRQGVGTQAGFLLADLMITDAVAIDAIRQGKREVSCGYDADYTQLEPGYGAQSNIIANHVALVEQGRCGPRCAIGDSRKMKREKLSWGDKARRAFAARDESAFEAALEESPDEGETKPDPEDMPTPKTGPGGPVAVHVHNYGPGNNSSPANPGVDTDAVDPAAQNPAVATDPNAAVDPAAAAKGDPIAIMGQRMDQIEQVVTQLAQAVAQLTGGGKEAPPEGTQDEAGEGEGADIEGVKVISGDGGMPDFLKNKGETADEVDPAAENESTPKIEGFKKFMGATDKKTGDAKIKVRDSAHLADRVNEVSRLAEILVPGIGIPTFDAKQPAAATLDSLCSFRRKALTTALKDSTIKDDVASIFGNPHPNVGKYTCDAIYGFFNGAANLVAARRNRGVFTGVLSSTFDTAGKSDIRSMNQRNAEFWKAKGQLT